ncbi:MAG: stage II sporulation protein M [Actinobacteria bacterium]|nr:MAG: stage II sporulation protein M [Actinomycetota bacterium]
MQVALVAFAGGMTAGILTGWSMLQNGLLLGALAGAAAKSGQALAFWSLIVPHGSLELPAIVLAGGSGLMLARAILFPGDLPRAASLRRAAGEAVRIVLGALPLFLLAGLVEGFFTPSATDPVLKLGVGTALAAAFVAYVLLTGRGEPEA